LETAVHHRYRSDRLDTVQKEGSMHASEIVVIGLTIGAMILCLSLVRAYNRYRTKAGPLSECETDTVAWMTALGLALIVGLTITVIGIIASTWR
jgi:hypothetical protein